MTVLETIPVAVEVAFGVRPGTVPDPGDWVDITDDVDVTARSSGVTADSGRDNPRTGITPGRLTLTLENSDGRYNPRNVLGPYYGDLVNGTPIRVTVPAPVTGCADIEVTFEGRADATSWIPSLELVDGSTSASVDFLGVQNGTPGAPTTAPTTGWSAPIPLGASLPVDVYGFYEDGSGDAVTVVSKYQVDVGACSYECYLWMDIGSTSDVGTVDVWVSGDGTTWEALTTSAATTVTSPGPSTTVSRWQGWIDSGWPQTITSRRPTVRITAHDLFGLMAQGESPTSAWDAYLSSYTPAPSHWWRPGPTGWIDAVTGLTMRHTGLLEQPGTGNDPIIAGEPQPYGQAEATGYGICQHASARLDTGTEQTTILTRFQLATVAQRTVAGLAEAVTIIDQTETAGYSPFRVTVSTGSIEILAIDADGLRQAYTADPNPTVRLMDGRPHTLLVDVPAGSGTIRAWLDGRAVTMTYSTSASSYTLDPGDVLVGYAGPAVSAKRPYQGYIDPLVVWRDHGGTTDELEALAVAAHNASTVAQAGLRLDERVTALVDAFGFGAHLGDLDVSGIVTQQAYEQDDPVALLQTIEDTEQGRIWVDRDGELRFSARGWAWTDTVSTAVQLTLSDDPVLIEAGDAEEMLEDGTEVVDDPRNIVNVAAVTSANGREQVVEDAASIAMFGRRNAVRLTGLLHPSDRQSRSIAEWLILSRATPQIQAPSVSFRVEDNPETLAPIAATIEEGSLVRIIKETDAETLDLYAHVIGMRQEWTYTGWTVTLTLDATRTGYSFFEWGSSNWGGSDGWAF